MSSAVSGCIPKAFEMTFISDSVGLSTSNHQTGRSPYLWALSPDAASDVWVGFPLPGGDFASGVSWMDGSGDTTFTSFSRFGDVTSSALGSAFPCDVARDG